MPAHLRLGHAVVAGAAAVLAASVLQAPVTAGGMPSARPAPLGATIAAQGSAAASMPAYPGPLRVTQPDGTRITLAAWGDAQSHGYRTPDGYAVARDASGVWRYAVARDGSGRLVPSSLEVGQDPPPRASKLLLARAQSDAAAARAAGAGPSAGQGTQPLLVVLVSFKDQGPVGSSEATWAEHFFGARGSLAAYYRDNSFDALRLHPARESQGTRDNGVVGWLKMPYRHPDFGGNYGSRHDRLTRDALEAADRYVDFQAFDKDGDGRLSVSELRIAIVVAGYETSYSGEDDVCGPSVWAHQGALLAGGPEVDGVAFDRDAGTMIGEWMCRVSESPGHLSTIGTSAALMGFDLGLPALFDRDGSSSGLGDWSLMAEGGWNRLPTGPAGSSPAMLDAFSKSLLGWVTPIGVYGGMQGAPIPPAETSPTAYRFLENPGGVDWVRGERRGQGEYFLVENRQQIGWDVGLPACGVLVYHVDEKVSPYGTVAGDRDSHRLVDVVEASGAKPLDDDAYNGSAADVFPGSSLHEWFSDATVPSARLYSGAPSGVFMHVTGGCPAGTMMAGDFTAPIPNDDFSAATVLDGPEGSVQGGSTGATRQPGEPMIAGNRGGASIWYRFRAPADGELALSTDHSTFDTLLGVYRGASVGALTTIDQNDNHGTGLWSAVNAPVERGKTYRIAIDGTESGLIPQSGLTRLTYAFRPANDDLRAATRLTGTRGRLVSSTKGATTEHKEPRTIAGQPFEHSVWYSYRARADGRLVVDLSGSDFDTLLALYTGSGFSHLHPVAADDDSAEGRRSRVVVDAVRGTTYRIAVAGVGEEAGKVVLRWHA